MSGTAGLFAGADAQDFLRRRREAPESRLAGLCDHGAPHLRGMRAAPERPAPRP